MNTINSEKIKKRFGDYSTIENEDWWFLFSFTIIGMFIGIATATYEENWMGLGICFIISFFLIICAILIIKNRNQHAAVVCEVTKENTLASKLIDKHPKIAARTLDILFVLISVTYGYGVVIVFILMKTAFDIKIVKEQYSMYFLGLVMMSAMVSTVIYIVSKVVIQYKNQIELNS